MVSDQCNSNFKRVVKMQSAEGQFLAVLIRVKDMIKESTKWP
jgi:hypothetical protein